MKLTIQINIEADTDTNDGGHLADFFGGLSLAFNAEAQASQHVSTSEISVEFDPEGDYDPTADLGPDLVVNSDLHPDAGWSTDEVVTAAVADAISSASQAVDAAPAVTPDEVPATAPAAPAAPESLLAAKGLKLTKSTAVAGGVRVAAGDSVKIATGDAVVLATARGWLEVETEDGHIIAVEAEDVRADEAAPAGEPAAPEQPEPEVPSPSSAPDGIEDAEIVSETPVLTVVELRALGRKVQEKVSVDAVTAAVKSVVPTARRLGDVPEDQYPAVAAAFEAAIAQAERGA